MNARIPGYQSDRQYLPSFTALDLAAIAGDLGNVRYLLAGEALNKAPEGMIASRFPDLIARAEKDYPEVAEALKSWRRWCEIAPQAQNPRPVSERVVRRLDFSESSGN